MPGKASSMVLGTLGLRAFSGGEARMTLRAAATVSAFCWAPSTSHTACQSKDTLAMQRPGWLCYAATLPMKFWTWIPIRWPHLLFCHTRTKQRWAASQVRKGRPSAITGCSMIIPRTFQTSQALAKSSQRSARHRDCRALESVLGRLVGDAAICAVHCVLDERLRQKERPCVCVVGGMWGRFGSFRDSFPGSFVVRSFIYSHLRSQ